MMCNKKIIIADDSEFMRFFIEELFCGDNNRFLFAENGSEVIQYIENKINPCIIFLDIEMPVLDGIETIKILKNKFSEKIQGVRIVAMTAHSKPDYLENLYQYGFDDYIVKPFNEKKLREKISHWCPLRDFL